MIAVCVLLTACSSARSTLPSSLSDDAFWRLTTELSEPPGEFTHSDTLVSNEIYFAENVRRLRRRGGIYIGVGPEQNFSFMARLRPELAFIVDIRQENRNLHLMYKALFELSIDRADFLSRLFSRARPPGVGPSTPVEDLFARYAAAAPSREIYDSNVRSIRERLLGAHRFPLAAGDIEWIEYALQAFHADGPDIHYGRSLAIDAPGPSYRVLMTRKDMMGVSRSYLASEEGFAFVKDLQARNLVVPVVGDFGGPHALTRVGEYLRRHNAWIEAFYGSNVEVYLTRAGQGAFCRNLALLPFRSRAWFIDNKAMQLVSAKLRACAPSR
jgi:hypothetical protein